MRGSIKKQGKGSWSLIVWVPDATSPSGKKQKWITFHGTKQEAEKELNRIVAKIEDGAYVSAGKLTFGKFLEQWNKDYVKTNLAPRTIESYEMIINQHLIPALGRFKLDKLKSVHIQNYYTEALEKGSKKGNGKLSRKTVLYHHHIIHEALKHAVRWGYISVNPADAVEPPHPQKSAIITLTLQQTVELLKLSEGFCYIPVLLAVTAGMREGEIFGVRWKDIDWENKTLHVVQVAEVVKNELIFRQPKTERSIRQIALMDFTVEALRDYQKVQSKQKLLLGDQYQDNGGLICCYPNGQPIKPGNFSHRFRNFIDKTNLPHIRFHDLRHTCATLMLEQNIHPKIVSELLGHSNIQITLDTYSHVLPSLQKSAVTKLEKAILDA